MKPTIQMIKQVCIAIVLIGYLLIGACKSTPQHTDEVYLKLDAVENVDGWGYEIYVNGKLYIKQDFIPVISGRHAFKTKQDALTAGKLVYNKLANGKIPAITAKELKDNNLLP